MVERVGDGPDGTSHGSGDRLGGFLSGGPADDLRAFLRWDLGGFGGATSCLPHNLDDPEREFAVDVEFANYLHLDFSRSLKGQYPPAQFGVMLDADAALDVTDLPGVSLTDLSVVSGARDRGHVVDGHPGPLVDVVHVVTAAEAHDGFVPDGVGHGSGGGTFQGYRVTVVQIGAQGVAIENLVRQQGGEVEILQRATPTLS